MLSDFLVIYLVFFVVSFLIILTFDLFSMPDQEFIPGMFILFFSPFLLLSIPFIKLYKLLKPIIRILENN